MAKQETQINPGKAGPKGALDLPAAKENKRGHKQDNHSQRNWGQLPRKRDSGRQRDGEN